MDPTFEFSQDKLAQLVMDIKKMKIQGATNVALTVIDGLLLAYNDWKNENNPYLYQYLYSKVSPLAFARPTEPLAQNALRYIFGQKEENPENYLERGWHYKEMIEDSKKKMGDIGQAFIQNGGVYLTHCHSSTVTQMFIKAYKSGKKFSVIATETRPNFQGRITVEELLKAGINDVTMIIDDVAPSLLLENNLKISAIFMGADLLSRDGFVNKIGSLSLAHCALEKSIPLYVLSILLKYDPRPFEYAMIEMRDGREIWPEAPAKLKFHTPVFDFVPYDDNLKIITETGIMEGRIAEQKAREIYPFVHSVSLPL